MRPMLTDRLLATGSACETWFRPEVVRRLVDEHAAGTHDHKRLLFALLAFELWHEQLVSAPRSSL
jgi:hypothetical protein